MTDNLPSASSSLEEQEAVVEPVFKDMVYSVYDRCEDNIRCKCQYIFLFDGYLNNVLFFFHV